jgi:integrase/recombinase XerD
MLFDGLIVGQNPAAAVRGPKHVVNKGKTPVLDGDYARRLLKSINITTTVGLRDRALIALLIYTFARVSAALHMNVEDYSPRPWLRMKARGPPSSTIGWATRSRSMRSSGSQFEVPQ